MATGDLNIGGINLSPGDLDKLSLEITNRLDATAKDPGQYEIAESLNGVTSLPVFRQSGQSYQLVRVLLEALKGMDGKNIQLRIAAGGDLQWAAEGSEAWTRLYTQTDLQGMPGKNPVFRAGATSLEYKLEGEEDAAYQPLIPYSRITGPAGDHVVFRVSGDRLQVKLSQAGDDAYADLYDLSALRGEQGETGPAPVLELGTVTTVEPARPAGAEMTETGVDPETGAKKYRLDFSLPKGQKGTDGTGSGNVLVPPAALKAGATYLFKPAADGSAEGEFVEYVAAAQAQADYDEMNQSAASYIRNKPALKPVATSGDYNDLLNKPTDMPAARLATGLKNNGLNSDLSQPLAVNGLSWCNQTTSNGFAWKYGNMLQFSNFDAPDPAASWSWINQILLGTDNQVYHRTYTNADGWSEAKRLAHADELPDLNNLTSTLTLNNAESVSGTKKGVGGRVAGTDYYGIYSYGTSANEGCLEFTTGGNGNEPVYVRQYASDPASTSPSQAVRGAALLDTNGNTSFPGTVYSGGKVLVRTDDARLSNARAASGGTADYATMVNGLYTQNGGQQPPSYIPSGKIRFNMMNTPINGDGSYKDWMLMDTYGGSDVAGVTAFGISKTNPLRAYIMQGAKGGAAWERTAELYHTGNLAPATQSVNGLMSTVDKKRADRNVGFNTVSSLTDLPADKRLILCSLTAPSGSFSFKEALESGSEYHIIIRNAGSSAITQSIFIGSGSVYFGGNSITIPPSGYYEVNLIYRENGIFYVRSGGE